MILLNKLFSSKKSAKARVDYPLLLLGAHNSAVENRFCKLRWKKCRFLKVGTTSIKISSTIWEYGESC